MKKILCITLSCLLFLTGCSGPRISFLMGGEPLLYAEKFEITDKEVKLVYLEYKREYDNYYKELLGESYWDMEVKDGVTFENFVKEEVLFPEMKALLFLQKMADEREIGLTAVEKEELSKKSKDYFEKMTEDDRKFTNAEIEDVQGLFEKYALGQKVIHELLEGKELSASDEESRIIDFEVIRVQTEQEAKEAIQRLRNGEVFSELAREISEDMKITYSLCKSDLIPNVSEILFAMSDNQISDICPLNDGYYIFHLTSSYNEILSENEKKNQSAVKTFEGWKSFYREEEKKTPCVRNESQWKKLSVPREGLFSNTDLFSYFQ